MFISIKSETSNYCLSIQKVTSKFGLQFSSPPLMAIKRCHFSGRNASELELCRPIRNRYISYRYKRVEAGLYIALGPEYQNIEFAIPIKTTVNDYPPDFIKVPVLIELCSYLSFFDGDLYSLLYNFFKPLAETLYINCLRLHGATRNEYSAILPVIFLQKHIQACDSKTIAVESFIIPRPDLFAGCLSYMVENLSDKLTFLSQINEYVEEASLEYPKFYSYLETKAVKEY